MKKKNFFKLSIFLLFIYSFTLAVNGDPLFQWVDENGVRHFSDIPPTSATTLKKNASTQTSQTKAPLKNNLSESNTSLKKGLFWKIEGRGIQPSYLLGTIHSDDKRILNLRPEIWKRFDQANSFIMEMKLDHTIFLKMGKAMVFTDGRDLKTVLDQKTYEGVVTALAGFGFTETLVRPMKPWAVMAILSTPRPQSGQFLDLYLYTKALEQKKGVYGLETAEEQLAVFDTMPMSDQVALLTMTLNQQKQIPVMFEEMILTYLKDDLAAIEKIATKYDANDDQELFQRFMYRLNDQRNIKMADRMVPFIKKGNSFIAIGALHLNGKSGLIKLLSDQGYHLSSIR